MYYNGIEIYFLNLYLNYVKKEIGEVHLKSEEINIIIVTNNDEITLIETVFELKITFGDIFEQVFL